MLVASGVRSLGAARRLRPRRVRGAAALRQLVLAARASRRAGEPWWRGVSGRANGGMVVHLGVVVLAVGFAASMSFVERDEFRLKPGESATLRGHTRHATSGPRRSSTPTALRSSASVRVDDEKIYRRR